MTTGGPPTAVIALTVAGGADHAAVEFWLKVPLCRFSAVSGCVK